MERMKCVVIEDNILEFLDEIETQLTNGVICCKCKKPCNQNGKCSVAMKNLLTDINMFRKAYTERNMQTEDEQTIEKVDEKEQEIEKQILND